MGEDQLIDTVDTHDLHRLNWPILRLLVPHWVEVRELERYLDDLTHLGRWSMIRAVPQQEPDGRPSYHRFAIYGRPVA